METCTLALDRPGPGAGCVAMVLASTLTSAGRATPPDCSFWTSIGISQRSSSRSATRDAVAELWMGVGLQRQCPHVPPGLAVQDMRGFVRSRERR